MRQSRLRFAHVLPTPIRLIIGQLRQRLDLSVQRFTPRRYLPRPFARIGQGLACSCPFSPGYGDGACLSLQLTKLIQQLALGIGPQQGLMRVLPMNIQQPLTRSPHLLQSDWHTINKGT